ncbi:MAG TPA: hypothetical protein VGO40_13110 [Longimicrobium sp.]|jgi:hypothetical protein|nr:hypothetical protein [Longimicrobium sp.]
MRKLRLDLDALAVESFDTAVRGAGRGTVAANRFEADLVPIGPKASRSDCADCYYTLPATCMSCGEDVCTMASRTDCPSCANSCNGCGPTCACPADERGA